MNDGPQASEKPLVEQPASIKKGRALFRRPCTFLQGVTKIAQLPDLSLAEVAFAGRSNVGKSTLINALIDHKNMARASNTPGRTQEINFFDLGGEIRLVDLPGYGHAEAPKKKVTAWQKLIKDYLKGRPNLRRVFILIDSRHGVKALDKEIFSLLDAAAVSYQIILTKTDKISSEALKSLLEKLPGVIKPYIALHPVIHATSGAHKEGLEVVRAEIALLA